MSPKGYYIFNGFIRKQIIFLLVKIIKDKDIFNMNEKP